MKKWLLLVAVAGLAALILPIMRPPGVSSGPGRDLPWQMTVAPGGAITVFGLTLGESTLGDAVAKLGRRYDLGLFREPDGRISLEAYFRDTLLGGLSARLVITAQLEPKALSALFGNAGPGKRLPGGVQKRAVAQADVAQALGAPIASLTYLPYVELDEDLVRKHFGEPLERIALEGETHWLYPELGLDVIRQQGGVTILQYVTPQDFDQLRMPLVRTLSDPSITGD